MPKPIDLRTVLGSVVKTCARAVSCEIECNRLYRALWRTKKFEGSVISVQSLLKNGRRQRHVKVKWQLSGKFKEASEHISNVKVSVQAVDVNCTDPTASSCTLSTKTSQNASLAFQQQRVTPVSPNPPCTSTRALNPTFIHQNTEI